MKIRKSAIIHPSRAKPRKWKGDIVSLLGLTWADVAVALQNPLGPSFHLDYQFWDTYAQSTAEFA